MASAVSGAIAVPDLFASQLPLLHDCATAEYRLLSDLTAAMVS